MTPGAEDRAGQERTARGTGAREPGDAMRLGLALGLSLVLHGLGAVALWGGASEPRHVEPGRALEVELVWREAARGSGPSPGRVGAPSPARKQERRAASRPVPPPAPEPRPGVPPALPVVAEASPELEPAEGTSRVEEAPGPGSAEADALEASPAGGGASEEGAPGTGHPGGGGAGGEVELLAYGEELSRQVGRQRRYPAQAVRLRLEGTTRVRVRLHRDGSLAGPPRLEDSSRFRVLDVEALRMVEAAAPFAPLPTSLPRAPWEFIIPVSFSLRASAG